MLEVLRFKFITESEHRDLIRAIDKTYAHVQVVMQLDINGSYQTYGQLYVHFSKLYANRLDEPYMENYMGESRYAFAMFMHDVFDVMKQTHYHFEYIESFRPMHIKRFNSPKGGFTNVGRI